MAFFKRPELEAQGITGAAQDWLMAELNRRLATNYISKTEAQEQAESAVQAALKEAPQSVNPTETAEYKAVVEERDMLRTLGGEDFAKVKPKFREYLYSQLDRSEGAKSISEQLEGMRGTLSECFAEATTTPAAAAPTFGAALDRVPPDKEMTEAEQVKASFEQGWRTVHETTKE